MSPLLLSHSIEIEEPSGRHAAMRAGAARRVPASPRLLKLLTLLVLLAACAGIAVRGRLELARWHERRTLDGLLQAIHHQQTRYMLTTRTYSGSLEALHIHLPEGVRGLLLAGPMAGRPGYLAELCGSSTCRAITQQGTLLDPRPGSGLRPGEIPETTVGEPATAPVASMPSTTPVASIPSTTPVASLPPTAPVASIPSTAGINPSMDMHTDPSPPVPLPVRVVPRARPEAFGLEAGRPLPALSPVKDSPALWGSIEEVRP